MRACVRACVHACVRARLLRSLYGQNLALCKYFNDDDDVGDDDDHDDTGRLRFTNVETGDTMHGRPYVCMAMNHMMRNTSQGPPIHVRLKGGKPFALWFLSLPTPVTFNRPRPSELRSFIDVSCTPTGVSEINYLT